MDYDYRSECASKINKTSYEMSYLRDIKRVYTMNDIAIMTRSEPAKILGLSDRGSLAPGCLADISIYNPNLKYDKMFRKPVYVFKDGNEIVKNGKINNFFKTKTQALNLSYDKNIEKYINKWIGKQYSLNTDDLSVDGNYFRYNNFNFH